MIGALAVNVLSVLVSAACAVLLFRGNRRSPSRLLLSAALCFSGLALSELALFVDVFALPDIDLVAVRTLPALLGLAVLVHALVKEGR